MLSSAITRGLNQELFVLKELTKGEWLRCTPSATSRFATRMSSGFGIKLRMVIADLDAHWPPWPQRTYSRGSR
jgi:hypothetical protein